MHPEVAGYQVEREIARYYASGLFEARERASDKPVLIKTLTAAFPDRRDIKRLEREYWVLKEFTGASGVLPVSNMHFLMDGKPAFISEASGLPLSYFLKTGEAAKWSLERKLAIAIETARAIDSVHARKVVHKNVAPQNILVSAENWTVQLMNFEIATSLAREHQDRSLSRRLEG